MDNNIDKFVVDGFGEEWKKFNQRGSDEIESEKLFINYFSIFPWEKIGKSAIGFDLGCGSGRWAKIASKKVHKLYCIDPSTEALKVARKNLINNLNCEFLNNGVGDFPLEDNSMDFGYSLGVLHHIPNTYEGIKSCVNKLKKNAPFLVYLYYAFDNRPWIFRQIWKFSNLFRIVISALPFFLMYPLTQVIAFFVYLPLSRISKILDYMGIDVDNIPLSYYKRSSFYTMRTDALDRFGTNLEQRFTKDQIKKMLKDSGLKNIIFSENMPHWCALGYKK